MINRLRNKRTGEIGYLWANKDMNYKVLDENDCVLGVYDTLPRLIEEWEEYKLNIWYNNAISGRYTIEIDFATDEEAKKAIDKLKAWQRLKEKGFEFEKWYTWEKVTGLACFDKGVARSYYAGFTFRNEDRLEKDEQVKADLDLLFGGKE